MTLEELIEEARERVGDEAEPYFCSDARFTKFANQAQEEACRRARLLVDSSTEELCVIDVEADEALYDLDPRVLFVRKASLDGQDRFLARVSRKDLDKLGAGWLTETGEVMGFVPDMDTGKVRLYRKPTEAGLLRMTVVRLPLEKLEASDDEPEIHARLHLSLVDWMEYRFYSINDAEVRDEKKAAAALASFEREFGPPATAIEEAWAAEQYGFQEDDGNVYGA